MLALGLLFRALRVCVRAYKKQLLKKCLPVAKVAVGCPPQH